MLLLLLQISEMVAARDAATYTAARDRAVAAGGVDETPDWPADWVRAVAIESVRTRINDPALAAAVDAPAGLDPANYTKFRRPEPMVVPELRKLGTAAVPLLIERWRWTFDALAATSDLERETMRLAILQVPGMLADARARGFLEDVLQNDTNAIHRQFAAVSLGQCGGSALLTTILDDAREPDEVREACARGIGHVADADALATLTARLDPRVIAALGILGNAAAWDARGGGDDIRRGSAEALVDALRRWPAEAPAIGIALSVTAWPESVAWVEALGTAEARVVLETLRPAVERRR